MQKRWSNLRGENPRRVKAGILLFHPQLCLVNTNIKIEHVAVEIPLSVSFIAKQSEPNRCIFYCLTKVWKRGGLFAPLFTLKNTYVYRVKMTVLFANVRNIDI